MQATITRFQSLDDVRRLYVGVDVAQIPTAAIGADGQTAVADFGTLSFADTSFTGNFRIRGTQQDRVSLGIQLGLSGHASQWDLDLEPGDVVVLPPRVERDGCARGEVRFATVALPKDAFLRLCGPNAPDLDRPRRFRADPRLRAFMVNGVACLSAEIRSGTPLGAAQGRMLEQKLVLPFLLGIAHDAVAADARPALASPSLVRRVEDWVDASDSEALSVVAISAALGVPLRTLQRAFHEALGIGPGHYLRLRRLARARAALAAADPATTRVTDVAMAEGFWDLGRFAVAYRRTFGERPSETLRRRPDRRPR